VCGGTVAYTVGRFYQFSNSEPLTRYFLGCKGANVALFALSFSSVSKKLVRRVHGRPALEIADHPLILGI
jgi:hypothetical protein